MTSDPIPAVLARLDARADALADDLAALIRIRSVNPTFDPTSPGETAMADEIERRYRSLDVPVERYEAAPGRPNLVARLNGTGGADGPHLLVNCHLDTVPGDVGEWYDPFTGERAGPWTRDPFGGVREDGVVHGRGAADHKSPIIALLYALEALRTEGVPLHGRLTCIHDADEETGGRLGVHHLATVIPFDFDMVLYACSSEFTPLGREFFTAMGRDNVIRAFAGWQTYRVTVEGQNLHNLTPRRAYGAIEAALPLADRIRDLAERVNARTIPLEGSGQPRMRIAAIETGDRAAFHHQARSCDLIVNRRIAAGEDPDAALRELQEVLDAHAAAYPDNPARYVVEREIRPHETPSDHPLIDAFAAAVRRVTGRDANVAGLPAPVGISALLQHVDVPTVLFGYGHLNQHHAPNEHIDESALLDMAKTYAVAIADVLGTDRA